MLVLSKRTQVHVVHATIARVLEKRVVFNSVLFRGAVQRNLADSDFIANQYTFDVRGILNCLLESCGDRREVGLRGGNFGLPDVAVHRDQITGESRQLPIGFRFTIDLAVDLNKIVGYRDFQSQAGTSRFVDRVLERLETLVSKHLGKIAGVPEQTAIWLGVILKTFSVFLEV